MKRPWTITVVALGLYLFLYLPISAVVLFSFNQARYGVVFTGFTTRWYQALWNNPEAWSCAKNTVILGVASAAIATLIGTTLGLALARGPLPGQRLWGKLLLVPVVVPDIVMAVALMLFYALLRRWLNFFELGLTTMILAHVTFQIPFVALVVRARLAGLDPSLAEAAHDLGATPWQTFWHVTLPLIRPGILAGAMLAFTLSLDDFVVSFFTSGPGATTLPILIYSSVKRGITPDINALSAVMVVISVAATIVLTSIRRRPA